MGWGYCGINTDTGEEMGYSVEGICHYPECNTKIDHGLSYVCGGMHQNGETCGYYFCQEHLHYGQLENGDWVQMCLECLDLFGKEDNTND